MTKYLFCITFLLLISVASAAIGTPEAPQARQQNVLNGLRGHLENVRRRDIFMNMARPAAAEMALLEGENQMRVDVDIRINVYVIEALRRNHLPGNDIDEDMRLRHVARELALRLILLVAIPFAYFAADRCICIRRALTPTDAMKRKLSTYSFRIMLVLCLALTEHLRIMLNWEKENAIKFFVPCLVFFWGLWLKCLNYPRPQ